MVPADRNEQGAAMQTIEHWINGAYTTSEGTARRLQDVTNPATGKVSGQLAMADAGLVNDAVATAKAAFPAWRDTSLARRTQVLFAYRELLNARKGELASIITAEHGKVLSDALGEVARGLEVVEFACGMPHLVKGAFTENASTRVMCILCVSRWVWWGSFRRSIFRRWCRCGFSRSRSRRVMRWC